MLRLALGYDQTDKAVLRHVDEDDRTKHTVIDTKGRKQMAYLIDNPTLSINEVSVHVGFSTPRNFSSQFKKMFGCLPSDYRSPKEAASMSAK